MRHYLENAPIEPAFRCTQGARACAKGPTQPRNAARRAVHGAAFPSGADRRRLPTPALRLPAGLAHTVLGEEARP